MRLFLSLLILLLPLWSAAAETIRIPKDHYLGISQPFQSEYLARKSALNELTKQVIRTIGGSYSMKFRSQVTQTGESFYQHASEELKYSASGFLTGIEGNVISESYDQTDDGIVCHILAHLPAHLLDRMKRLSMGAKVLVSDLGDGVFEFREVNGVDVILTGVKIAITEINRHARFISYYLVKVPFSINDYKIMPLEEPILLRAGVTQKMQLPIFDKPMQILDLVLGKKRTFILRFFGIDEIGRSITILHNYDNI